MVWSKFPSPYGEVGFDPESVSVLKGYDTAMCFRPLTGKLVLIWVTIENATRAFTYQFPSPYGEVGFDLRAWNECIEDKDMFPSPYGEVGFDLRLR